jgi:hypothetical protein
MTAMMSNYQHTYGVRVNEAKPYGVRIPVHEAAA